jgi:predicted aspartyl protease
MRLHVGYWAPQQPIVLEVMLRNPKTGGFLPKQLLILDTGFRGLKAVALSLGTCRRLGLGIKGSTVVRSASGFQDTLIADDVTVEVMGRRVLSNVIVVELDPGLISLDLASSLFDSLEIDFHSGKVWAEIDGTQK